MAATIASVTETIDNTGSANLTGNYPAVVNAGDLLFIHFSTFDDVGRTLTLTDTNGVVTTKLADDPHNNFAGSALWNKVAVGNEGGTTFTIGNNGGDNGYILVVRITGWGGTLATDVDFNGYADSGASGTANPDAPAATAGWGSDDNLFLSFYTWLTVGSITFTTPPTNYATEETGVCTDAGGAVVSRTLTASTDDPGTATLSAGEDSCTISVVIKPGAAVTAAIGGTAGDGATEAQIVAGGQTITIELTDGTFVPAASYTPISFIANALGGTTTTTSLSITLPATQAGDIIILEFAHRGTGDGTVGGTYNGGAFALKHDQLFATSTFSGLTYWSRATGNHTGQTVTVTGLTNACAGIITIYRGCLASGDPLTGATIVGEQNASGNETQAQITTTVDGAWVVLVVANSPDVALSSQACTSPGALAERAEVLSTGGTDAAIGHASAEKAVAGATGAFTWAQTNGASGSWAYAIKPNPTTPFATAVPAFIQGFDSAQSEAGGWNAKVRDVVLTGVARTSDTVATWTLPAVGDYEITASETITDTVPASILASGGPITATPTFAITPTVVVSGTGAVTLPSLTAAGTGTASAAPTGTGAVTLPSLTASGSGNVPTPYPVILSKTIAQYPSDTDYDVTLPTLLEGDLVILEIAMVGDDGISIAPASGWHEFFDQTNANDAHLALHAKIMTAAESTDVITLVASSARVAIITITRIAAGTYPAGSITDIMTAANSTAVATVNPDPPNLDPSWGNEATLYGVAMSQGTDAVVSAYPTDFADNQTQLNNGSAVALASATRKHTADSLNPGTFTSDTSYEYVAATWAVRGIGAAPSGTGAATLPSLVASGTGLKIHTSTGAATLPGLNAVATGVMLPSGVGAATLPNLTASGTAVHQQTSAGAVTLPSLTATGTSAQVYTATGAPSLPSLTAAGIGVMQPSGAGSATLPSLTGSGTGSVSVVSTGAATLPSLTASGTAVHQQTATGAATLPSLTASGTSVVLPSGTADVTLPGLTASGTAVHQQTSTGAVTLPSLVATGTAEHSHSGTGTPTLPSLTASATGVMHPSGTGVTTLPSLTASGTAVHEQTSTGTATLPSLTANASTIHEQTATGASTLPSLTASGTAVMQPSATGAVTLPSLAVSGTAIHEQTATGAVSLPSLTATGTAVMQPSGTAVVALPSLTASGTSVHEQTATGAATLPSLIAEAEGQSLAGASGTGAATLPSLTAAAEGYMEPTGTGAATLPSLTCTADGLHIQAVTGTAECALPSLTASGSGTQTLTGTAAVTLPSLTCSGAATLAQTGTGVCTLPSLTCSGTALVIFTGTAVVTLPNLVTLATGTVVITNITGTVAVTLPSLSSSGAAVIILNVIIQAILEGCVDLDDLIERRKWIDNVLASGYAKGIDVPIPSGFIEPRETVVPSGYIKSPGSGNLWDI